MDIAVVSSFKLLTQHIQFISNHSQNVTMSFRYKSCFDYYIPQSAPERDPCRQPSASWMFTQVLMTSHYARTPPCVYLPPLKERVSRIKQNSKMKLLTHNILTSNIIKGVTRGFPLKIKVSKKVHTVNVSVLRSIHSSIVVSSFAALVFPQALIHQKMKIRIKKEKYTKVFTCNLEIRGRIELKTCLLNLISHKQFVMKYFTHIGWLLSFGFCFVFYVCTISS